MQCKWNWNDIENEIDMKCQRAWCKSDEVPLDYEGFRWQRGIEMNMKWKWHEMKIKWTWNDNGSEMTWKWNGNEMEVKCKWDENESQMK